MALFTARVDYALRALIELAQHPFGEAEQSREIAQRQDIPEAYLNQLLVALRRAGLVRSIRGAAGGYTLARSPSELRVSDVLRAVNGADWLDEAEADGAADGSAAWVVRDLDRQIGRSVRDSLDRTTIADLLDRTHRLDESRSLMHDI